MSDHVLQLALQRAEWAANKGYADRDELSSAAVVAAWEAERVYSDDRGVPLDAWVSVCVANAIRDVARRHCRRNRQRHEVPLTDRDEPREADEPEQIAQLRQALSRLHGRDRAILEHRFFGGLPVRDIAFWTHSTVAEVRGSIERSINTLRQEIKGADGES